VKPLLSYSIWKAKKEEIRKREKELKAAAKKAAEEERKRKISWFGKVKNEIIEFGESVKKEIENDKV
jgi:hypothetical protein